MWEKWERIDTIPIPTIDFVSRLDPFYWLWPDPTEYVIPCVNSYDDLCVWPISWGPSELARISITLGDEPATQKQRIHLKSPHPSHTTRNPQDQDTSSGTPGGTSHLILLAGLTAILFFLIMSELRRSRTDFQFCMTDDSVCGRCYSINVDVVFRGIYWLWISSSRERPDSVIQIQ